VCRALGQHRSTQRKRLRGRDDEERLTDDMIDLARQYGRYGYRTIAELLRSAAGWVVNDKRVERIWRREGLRVSEKEPKRGRLWRTDGSCFGSSCATQASSADQAGRPTAGHALTFTPGPFCWGRPKAAGRGKHT
jgi:hypothetical protein